MKSHELYKQLDPVVVQEMFTTFRDEEREIYKSAVASIAQARKLRPVFIQKKPVPEQIAWMHKTLGLRSADMIGEHLFQVWFMKFHQPMLIDFCDKMEIPHNGEGSVEGELPAELDAAKLKETADTLFEKFNPRIVSLYLYVFNLQRPGGWPSLAELIENDRRVALNDDTPEPEPEPGSDEVPAEPSSEPTEESSEKEEPPAGEEEGEAPAEDATESAKNE